MIQIFLSINNNEEVMQLPVPPPDYYVSSPWKNEQVEGLQQVLNVPGIKGLKTIEIKSFFPAEGHNYPFLQSRSKWGMAYVDTIERWRSRKLPIRLVIVDSSNGKKNLNIPVTIDDFTHGIKQDGDIEFTLQMTEFAFISTRS